MVADQPEELARDLRTIADRIEDGEYDVSNIEISTPAPDGEHPGRFKIEFYTEEEMRRMEKVFARQVPEYE